MLTLLAANKGRGPWYLKGSSPHVLYAIGKTYWIVKDAIDDPNVDIDFSRYGQENEKNAIKAATALLKGEISLRSLYESLKCKDLCLKKNTVSNNNNSRRADRRNKRHSDRNSRFGRYRERL